MFIQIIWYYLGQKIIFHKLKYFQETKKYIVEKTVQIVEPSDAES